MQPESSQNQDRNPSHSSILFHQELLHKEMKHLHKEVNAQMKHILTIETELTEIKQMLQNVPSSRKRKYLNTDPSSKNILFSSKKSKKNTYNDNYIPLTTIHSSRADIESDVATVRYNDDTDNKSISSTIFVQEVDIE